MYHQKTISDPDFGTVTLRKQSGISNIRLSVHPRRGISLTIPWHLKYSDGIEFMREKRDWIAEMMIRQKQRMDKARREGRGMPEIYDGITIRTQHQEIIIRRSPQGTLFGIDETWEHPLQDYVRTVSKRRGTMEQTADIVHTESNCPYLRPGVKSALLEGNIKPSSVCVTRITYPYEWGEALATGSTQERMITENIIQAMRKEARTFLPERLSKLAAAYGFEYAGVHIKNNLTNWGSCSSAGNINLNLHLVRLPQYLSDYVILHEICHLRHMNHGNEYQKLLTEVCAEHYSEEIGEGRTYTDSQNAVKKLSGELRRYYLW